MDSQIFFKNIIVAALLLGIIAFAAVGYRAGSTYGAGYGGVQGGGYYNNSSGWGGEGDD